MAGNEIITELKISGAELSKAAVSAFITQSKTAAADQSKASKQALDAQIAYDNKKFAGEKATADKLVQLDQQIAVKRLQAAGKFRAAELTETRQHYDNLIKVAATAGEKQRLLTLKNLEQ